jgi:hypothetical protein
MNRRALSSSHPARRLDDEVVGWRREQLVAAGFPSALALQPARDARLDLHALIELVERGCPPDRALRILAPLEDPAPAERAVRLARRSP